MGHAFAKYELTQIRQRIRSGKERRLKEGRSAAPVGTVWLPNGWFET